MSSFFTTPASQRKRKRVQPNAPSESSARKRDSRDDESISGSDVSDAVEEDAEGSEEDEDEFEDDDPAAKRVRLAERYLANTKDEILDDGDFDAADVDQENLRERMGDRLKADTAESKGKLYRWIADTFDWPGAARKICRRIDVHKCLTGVAIHSEHLFAVSKDVQLVKLQLPGPGSRDRGHGSAKNAKVLARTRGGKKFERGQHHSKAILCVAVSPDGRFVATGGADKKLIIWDAISLKALKVFTQHRDAVNSLVFRKSTNQLYSASRDRTVKIWSLDELAYVETLFGHQDEIVDVDAVAQEKCVTAGARDRTARFWKVVEESQLVFRGGGAPGTHKALNKLKQAYAGDGENIADLERGYNEGSIDRIAMIDDDTFVTGSDNGSLSLWNVNKKKAVFTLPLAHGLEPALPLEQASAELEPDATADDSSRGGEQPRWITALKAIPLSDVFITGSWDGYIRAWKISRDKRRIESLGAVGSSGYNLETLLDQEGLQQESLTNGALEAVKAGLDARGPINGIVNDLAVVDRGERGKDGLLIAAAFGKEHRLGRWKNIVDGRNCVALYGVPLRGKDESLSDYDEDFGGFD